MNKTVKNRVVKLLVTGGGAGYLRPASGTWGTLVGAFIAYILWLVFPSFYSSSIGFSTVAVLIVASSLISTSALVEDPTSGDDPHWIVLDEIVGLFVSLLGNFHTTTSLVAAFFIFRFFDITKPFPARNAEELPQGWGVVLDDVVAGVYTNLVLYLLTRIANL